MIRTVPDWLIKTSSRISGIFVTGAVLFFCVLRTSRMLLGCTELIQSLNVLSNLIAQMMFDREMAEWARRLDDSPEAAHRPIYVVWIVF